MLAKRYIAEQLTLKNVDIGLINQVKNLESKLFFYHQLFSAKYSLFDVIKKEIYFILRSISEDDYQLKILISIVFEQLSNKTKKENSQYFFNQYKKLI